MSRLLSVLFAAALMVIPSAALAQTDGSIRGYIHDEQGAALPGVTVTATSPAAATPVTAVSDEQGFYRLLNLAPGTYSVSAELPGFSKFVRENVEMRAGLNLGVDVTLKIGTLSETIDVRGDSPLLETKEAGQAVNVSGEMQQSIPLAARRHWSEFLRFTPGAVSSETATDQASVFYIHGAGIVSFSTLVDGADMSSAVNPWQGYVALPDGSVADVQIKTSGLDAATPLGFGAASNVATLSGTNKLKGGFTYAYTPIQWVGNNQPGGSVQSMSVQQPEALLGGPIMKDKLWFFGSYRYRKGTLGISRAAADVSFLKAVDPGFTPFDNQISANIWFAKVNGQINAKHQFSAFVNHDSTPYDSNSAFNAATYGRVIIGGTGVAARVQSVWTNWLTSNTGYSWNNKGASTHLVNTNAVSQNLFRGTILSAGQLSGTGQFGIIGSTVSASQSPYDKWTVNSDWTAYHAGWIGSHEFQFGVFLQPRMHRLDTIDYANGGVAEDDYVLRNPNDPTQGMALFKEVVYDAAGGILAQGHFSDNAVYVQDSWRPVPSLTISAGVRIDHVGRVDDLFGLQVESATDIGPRLGVNYLLTKDQRNAVRFSYMRVHDAANVNQQTAGGAGTQGSGSQTIGFKTLYDLNLDGVWDSTFVTPAASKTNPSRVIDPNYDQPYVDEWATGYRRQLPGQASFDIGYIHRLFKNRTALVEQNGIYNGNQFVGYQNVALNDIFVLTTDQWNWPVYDALELIGTKRTTNIQVVGSYTHVWPHMAGTWQPRDPASFIQPNAFPNDKGLQSNDNRSTALNNGYSATTGSPEWTTDIGRVSVSYHAPWDLQVAANYTLQYGRWSGPIFTRIAAPDPQFGPATVTLSNGRLVSNPLATTLRFANATQSDGQFVLPATHYFNLRFARDFKLMATNRINVAFDLLNVANAGGFQGFLTGANQLFSANYGKGGQVQTPRTYQLSFRYTF
jgi:outer membrane receptor protein involved in Fe transport